MGGNIWTSPDAKAAIATSGNYAIGSGAAVDSVHEYLERGSGEITQKSITLTLNNTTGSLNLFQVTGNIKLFRLHAVVTTVISNPVTACSFDFYDSTSAVQITKNDGVLTSHPVGGWVGKTGVFGNTFTKVSSAAGTVTENVNPDIFWPCLLTSKAGANNYIRLTYTCNNQSSGVLLVTAEWRGHGGGTLVAV